MVFKTWRLVQKSLSWTKTAIGPCSSAHPTLNIAGSQPVQHVLCTLYAYSRTVQSRQPSGKSTQHVWCKIKPAMITVILAKY